MLNVGIDAFSLPAKKRGASTSCSNNRWNANYDYDVRIATRIPQSRHGDGSRILFAVSDNATVEPSTPELATAKTATIKGTASTTSSAGTKKNKNSNKRKNRTKKQHSNKNKQRRYKQQRKQRQKSNSSFQPQQHQQRPFSDLTLDELKQLTEYYLAQNIRPGHDAHGSDGTMSPQQMHEFSRLLSSWSKFSPDSNHNHHNNRNRGGGSNNRRKRTLAAEMAEQCLRELIEEQNAGNEGANKVISVDMYYLVIKAWLKVGGYKELVHASLLLDLMEQNNVESSTKCYAAVLDGWCKSKSKGAEMEAEKILERMGSRDGVGRDVRHYNNVMNRIAMGGKSNAGVEAERLLMEMIKLYKASYKEGGMNTVNGDSSKPASTSAASANGMDMAPTRSSFNTVIKAYANAGGRNAARNAQRILGMMEDPSSSLGIDKDDTDTLEMLQNNIAPDKISYTSILMAWANTNKSGERGDRDAGERAEELLESMACAGIEPDTVTYNAVLKVWGKCGHRNAGERSEALLDKMLQLYESGDSDVIPDDVTFNTVIHNVANSNAMDSPQRAMRLLERMKQSHESGLIRAKPDIISYNSVLNAFAKSGGPESAQHAEELLDSLEKRSNNNNINSGSTGWEIRPDVYSYNIVISAWGNCGYANKAVALLDRMTALTNEGKANLRPDATTYNTVLHAWSQSSDRNAPVKALGLLEIMLRLDEGGDRSANPDVLSFSTVINAFSKSKFPRKARQTRDLLRRMKQLYENGQERMRPNVYVYAAVLNACAYTFGRSEEKEEALKIGIETYEELQSSTEIETNHVAYGSFFRVCRRLMDDDYRRDDLITSAFRQCCSDGQLGEYVLRQLRAVPELYVSLLQAYIIDGEVLYQDLPSSWKCNVKDTKRKKGEAQFGRKKNGRS